jgi:hypothetical protein
VAAVTGFALRRATGGVVFFDHLAFWEALVVLCHRVLRRDSGREPSLAYSGQCPSAR